MKKVTRKNGHLKNRFITVLKNPLFWILTITGNAIILLGSGVLLFFEQPAQIKSLQYIDYLLWTAGLVTTIGYGDYMAQTIHGKFIVLFMMLIGTLFIWSYMAFLVAGFFTPELKSIEKDFREFEKEWLELNNSNFSDRKVNHEKV